MLKKENRLTKSKDFSNIYRRVKKGVSKRLVIYCLPNRAAAKTRIGFSVSRKVGNAVERNRIKRRLRELIRHLPIVQSSGFDLVIVARSKSKTATFRALEQDMEDLFQQLGFPTERENND